MGHLQHRKHTSYKFLYSTNTDSKTICGDGADGASGASGASGADGADGADGAARSSPPLPPSSSRHPHRSKAYTTPYSSNRCNTPIPHVPVIHTTNRINYSIKRASK